MPKYLIQKGPYRDFVDLSCYMIGPGDISKFISKWCGEMGYKVDRKSISIDFKNKKIHFDYSNEFNEEFEYKATWKLVEIERI